MKELKARPSELLGIENAVLVGELAEEKINHLKTKARLIEIQIVLLKKSLTEIPESIKKEESKIQEGKAKHELVVSGLAKRLDIDISKYEVDSESGLITPIEAKQEDI
jgi:hypothetical protein